MKNAGYLSILLIIFFISCEEEKKPSDNVVTIEMGSTHDKDVYYDFQNGITGESVRSSWDLSFSVPLQTATIRTNEGAGVELYTWGDTTTWETADTSALSAIVFNDNSDWMKGAFNRYARGGFNFGWATYDHGGTYSVWGDSIYIIRLTNGAFKKLFIRKRDGFTDTYLMRWANIDGSQQTDVSFSPAPYSGSKNFIQYSIVGQQVVESEPDKENWDLMFTKYIAHIPAGPGMIINYPVVGVLMRQGLTGMKVEGSDPATAQYSNGEFSEDADVIGWEWKVSDPVTREISLVPNTTYFVKVSDTEIYKIYFTGYDSQNNGTITLKVEKAE